MTVLPGKPFPLTAFVSPPCLLLGCGQPPLAERRLSAVTIPSGVGLKAPSVALPIAEMARATLIDLQSLVCYRGEAVFAVVTFTGALQTTAWQLERDDLDGHKIPYETPYESCKRTGSPQSTRTAMRSHIKFPSTTYGDFAAL